jgi:hypothetical protein
MLPSSCYELNHVRCGSATPAAVRSSIFWLVRTQHYLDGIGHCEACGELFPCSVVDRRLRELHRKVQPELVAPELEQHSLRSLNQISIKGLDQAQCRALNHAYVTLM